MFLRRLTVFILLMVLLLSGCYSEKHIYDATSRERQNELQKHRSGNIFTDIGLSLASVFVLAVADVNVGLYPDGHEFKKLKIINPAKDTLYVNMLTDVFWDEANYCDFLDIRVPPKENCKLLVPVDAVYNIYFSNTPQSDDDEFIEINTTNFKRISLYPGLTKPEENNNLNQ